MTDLPTARRESGANEREDLLGNPGQICCDFVTQYLSAIVQTEAFLRLGHEQLKQVRQTPSWPKSWANFSLS